MTPKELKKLVKTCRDLGVKTYKGPDFEFTLSDVEPEKPRKGKQAQASSSPAVSSDFETESLSPEEMLFWSSQGGIPMSLNNGEEK